MVARILNSRSWKVATGPIGFALALAWLTWLFVVWVWPVSWWFEVRDVFVHDSVEGEPITLNVDRVIARDFHGQYNVQIRVIDRDGHIGPVECDGGSGGPYRVGSEMRLPVTMEWWAAGRCARLPVGTYRAITTWYITPSFPFLPTKTLTVISNRFAVHPREGS